ncbi:hypothetical protein [Shewanella chilikensis]|uniref:Lipoprotein n=1 Tax=Shewanella chilikensis TaxID=558541 RepID=A0A6G7LQ41_9GAMM|nr:hypothetical protein [Shewanella chilikensis]QIJ03860.1 hypothetical protein GII14_06485 [Shewanella chilikensis]
MRNTINVLYRKIALVILLLFLAGCETEEIKSMDILEVKIAGTKLFIPKSYVLSDLPTLIVADKNLDSQSEQLSLKVPLFEFNVESKGDSSLLGNAILLIGNVVGEGPSKDIDDAKSQLGLYKGAIIEKDSYLGLYRVYPKSGYPKLWHYFKADTDSIDESDEWFGSCTVGPLEDEKYDLSNVKCTAVTSYKDVSIKYTTNAKYFLADFKLKQAIISTFKRWDEASVH